VRGLALTPDGQRLVSAGAEGVVNLWSVPSGELLTTFSGHGAGVWSLSLSGNGSLVASGCGDGSIKLWDLATCQLRTTLAGHKGIVLGVAFNADGRVLASAGGDGVIRVWDALAGRELRAMYIERCYERVDITGLGGITDAQRRTLVELGAVTSARLGNLRTIAPDKALVADSFQR
jgi:WD40 repeat protein